MAIESFFNRPGSRTEIADRVLNDIKYARTKVLLSMAYLSDQALLSALKGIRTTRRVVLNKNDISDPSEPKKAIKYKELCNAIGEDNIVALGKNFSIMHHKFIIIDDKVLWIGSYNFSQNARNNNWENMIRITDSKVIEDFTKEFNTLFVIGKALQVKPNLEITKCTKCSTEIDDPTFHYAYGVSHTKEITYNAKIDLVDNNYEMINRLDDIEVPKIYKRYDLVCKTKSPHVVKSGLYSCCRCAKIIDSTEVITTHFSTILKPTDNKGNVIKTMPHKAIYRFCINCVYDALVDYSPYEPQIQIPASSPVHTE